MHLLRALSFFSSLVCGMSNEIIEKPMRVTCIGARSGQMKKYMETMKDQNWIAQFLFHSLMKKKDFWKKTHTTQMTSKRLIPFCATLCFFVGIHSVHDEISRYLITIGKPITKEKSLATSLEAFSAFDQENLLPIFVTTQRPFSPIFQEGYRRLSGLGYHRSPYSLKAEILMNSHNEKDSEELLIIEEKNFCALTPRKDLITLKKNSTP
jgi:hypothetical protein